MNVSDIYRIDNVAEIPSPSLIIFRPIVEQNLRSMIDIAGHPDRLRPHCKTHKMPALIQMMERAGIHKHKCATIAEAEMIARAGGRDVLLAYPLVGPNLDRFARLVLAYPDTTFRALVDQIETADALNSALAAAGRTTPVPTLVDLNVGMGRTGTHVGHAAEVYRHLATLKHLKPDGLHAYDGHIRDFDRNDRRIAAQPGLQAVRQLRESLEAEGLYVPRLILGGTPTFPVHAELDDPGVECSPGTLILHDHSYQTLFPDLPFTPAALLLTRVISRPQAGRVCLDLGHKAVAADPQGDRLRLLGVDDAQLGGQSEEHLVVHTQHDASLPPGTPLLAIPTHICPTCALHQEAIVVADGQIVDHWPVAARDRRITI